MGHPRNSITPTPTAVLYCLWITWGTLQPVPAQNFAVTSGDGLNYTINAQSDPTFTLQRGVTYIFQINNLTFHPFYIKSSTGFGSTGAYNNGVLNNGATSGTITFTVPANAPDTLFYQCGNHSSMLGTLNIVTPAIPPTVQIVYINVGDFITIKSTGTNGWSASPEYKCNISELGWSPVANFTNNLTAGTNTTTFPRLDPICGSSNVFIRIRNQSN
ncbi:MAG: hypothetical protein QM813_22280 [Verrucomicrobiota bacterium]